MIEGYGWCIRVHNSKSISSKITEIWHKTCKKNVIFTSFRDFTVIFLILFFLIDFDASKSDLGPFFKSFAKIWPKSMYRSTKSRNLLVWPFYLVTWDDLDLYYGHKAQEMIFTHVSTHADSLTLFVLNIKIVLANVTKTEKSNILTFTWPVTSPVTSRSNFTPCLEISRSGLSNGVWILEIGPVVWEITGGWRYAPPPHTHTMCDSWESNGARVRLPILGKIRFMIHIPKINVGKFVGSEPWLVVIVRVSSDSGGVPVQVEKWNIF